MGNIREQKQPLKIDNVYNFIQDFLLQPKLRTTWKLVFLELLVMTVLVMSVTDDSVTDDSVTDDSVTDECCWW